MSSPTPKRLSKREKSLVKSVLSRMGMPASYLKARNQVNKRLLEGYFCRMEKALLTNTPSENVAKFMGRVRATWT